MQTLTPGGMRRLNEKKRLGDVRVLNVAPIEEVDDNTMPGDYFDNTFASDVLLPEYERTNGWVDEDDNAGNDEARQVYDDLLHGVRKM